MSNTIDSPRLIDSLVVDAVGEFHGGVYPPENKHQSMQLPLTTLPIPKELIFPLSQHMGTPAEPIVSIGEKVLGGQKIAEAIGVFSAAIHASSSGVVTAIEERALPHPSGMKGLCIVIETNGEHQLHTYEGVVNYNTQTPAELLDRIRDAGITGLGGAGFPTAVKLKPQAQHTINTLILNGTECEPYITADHTLMLHYASDVIKGAKLLAFILGSPEKILIGVEDNKPDAITALKAELEKPEHRQANITIVTFPTKYPSGGEKQLIQLLTGKEVGSGEIPASLGIVVQNVGTAVAAYRAVALGQPLTSRITTFVGHALKEQRNVEVLLGTPIESILDTLGFDTSNNERLIMGGPMMGFALKTAATPVIKSTNCVIAPSKQELPTQALAQECIRCGMCAEACPASLLPQQLYWYAKAEEYERAQNHQLFDCIECGACSFVCPSNIPLVQYYRSAKGAIRHQEQEQVKSDHARQRFEFRKLRIEKAEAEKIAKREARKKAAAEAKRLQAEKAENTANADTSSGEASTVNTTVTPAVAAAMEKIKAQKNDPKAQRAKLERTLKSAQDRLVKLQDKLDKIEDEHKDRISAQVKQTELRVQEAEKQLNDFLAQEKTTGTAPHPASDKVDDIINKAKANRDTLATMPESEKLSKQINALEQRLKKANDKLARAVEDNDIHIDAFRNGVNKLEEKLAALEQQKNNS